MSERQHNIGYLKSFRKTLRSGMTPAEAKLWTYLQKSQLGGRKFRRQHSINNYILDFYCSSEKLAIELDGEVHNDREQAERDRERDIFLHETGVLVLRFENKYVFENIEGVLMEIQRNFKNFTTPTCGHPSLAGGELGKEEK